MASFRYKALSPSGEVVQGTMEAASRDDVVARLQDAGNIPVEALEADAGAGAVSLVSLLRPRGVGAREIADFTQQLATLVRAGLPLDRALGIMVDVSDNERMGRLVERIRDTVRGGSSLSDALEAQHGVFSRLYVNMVRAGEVGGALDETLDRLALYLERAKELKGSVVSALIYPAILVLLAIASLLVLLVFVIPRFTPIFEQLGGELPLVTKIVLFFAASLRDFWWLILLVVGGATVWFQRQMARPETRYAWDARFLSWPILGGLLTRIETARLARTVGTLLKNGVPLLSALSISRSITSNTVLGEAVDEATKEVKTGGGLAHTLAKSKRFPRLALQMVAVGEETGQLDEMLLRVADTYDREVRTTIERALALLVPVMTLAMTVLIGFIVIAVLLAILQVTELV